MKEKELFKQLHNLSKMQPDKKWKDGQRSIMMNQINAEETESANDSISLGDLIKLPIASLQSFSQPVMVAFLFVFMVLTGGFAGLRVSQDSKPGDSLYLAKIAGEKTQLALTLSSEKKARLGLEFAVNRAEEIKQVIETEEESEQKEEKVERLVEEYKKELKVAKQHIEKISQESEESNEEKDTTISNLDGEATTTEEDSQIFTAGSQKSDDGLQVSDTRNNDSASLAPTSDEPVNQEISEVDIDTASSTDDEISSSSDILLEGQKNDEPGLSPELLLEQVPGLLEAKAYDELVDIIDEAGSAIDTAVEDRGEVKGVEEDAEDSSELLSEPESDPIDKAASSSAS